MTECLLSLDYNDKMKSRYCDLLNKYKLYTKYKNIEIIKKAYYNYKKFILRVNEVRKSNKKPFLNKNEMFPKDNYYKLNIKEDNLENYGMVSSSLWNLDSKQDYVWTKENNLLVVDGHGTNILINWIRRLSDEILMTAFSGDNNPIEYLEELLKSSYLYTKKTGACVTAIKIRESKIDIYKVGDANASVYINNEFIIETDDHTALNETEYKRKELDGAKFIEQLILCTLPPNEDGTINISKKMGYYIEHTPTDICVTSRTMGHAEMGKSSYTGTFIEHKKKKSIKK